MEFDRYTIVLLVRPEAAPKFDEAREDALQDAHLDHLATLHERGIVLAAGPMPGAEDRRLRGISILSLPPDEARALEETDPAVREGLLAVEVVPWVVPHGTIRFLPSRFPHSMAEASGP